MQIISNDHLLLLMKEQKIGKGLRESVKLPTTSFEWDKCDFLVLRTRGGRGVLIYDGLAKAIEVAGPLQDTTT